MIGKKIKARKAAPMMMMMKAVPAKRFLQAR